MSQMEKGSQRRRTVLRRLGWVVGGVVVLLIVVHLAGFVFEIVASKGDLRRTPPPGERVDVGGHMLHIQCAGQRENGAPLVVLEAGHGVGGAGWELVQSEVAKFARVCSYDRAGYVWSEPGPRPRTSRQITDELHALLSAAGEGGPYILVGASFGGHMVRLYAHDHPDDVVGVVLVDPRPVEIVDPVLKQEMAATNPVGVLMTVGSRFGFLRLMPDLIMSAAGMDNLANYPAVLAVSSKTVAASDAESRAMPESDAQVRATGLLGDMPLIVLRHGVPGMWKSEQAEQAWQQALQALADLSTNGSSIVAEKSGHNIMADQPEVVVDAIRNVMQAAR
jgi:pimeloyl-ACP methyl ester carboxylesterase